jgi:hypothetical protein
VNNCELTVKNNRCFIINKYLGRSNYLYSIINIINTECNKFLIEAVIPFPALINMLSLSLFYKTDHRPDNLPGMCSRVCFQVDIFCLKQVLNHLFEIFRFMQLVL